MKSAMGFESMTILMQSGGWERGLVDTVGSLVSSRLDPVEWHPPDPPDLEDALKPNNELIGVERVAVVDGPEDVAFDEEGRLYASSGDGSVYRSIDPVGVDTTDAEVEAFAELDGRPLGMEFHGRDLLVAATDGGLQAVSPDGTVETLAKTAGGRPIRFANDIHVSADGKVYFTDATVHDRYINELFELRDTGRLLAYHPETDETTVDLEDLGFANGVAPGPAGNSLLITESSRYRITRYWIEGDRRGESETFAENLVGYPDNIDVADGGSYWVAIPALREPRFDRLHHYPWLIRQLGRLPKRLLDRVSPDAYGLVIRISSHGAVLGSLHDPTGDVFYVTSVTPHGGALYLGTLIGDAVVRYVLD